MIYWAYHIPKGSLNNWHLRIAGGGILTALVIPENMNLHSASRMLRYSFLYKPLLLPQPRIPHLSVSVQKVIDFFRRLNEERHALNFHRMHPIYQGGIQHLQMMS